METVIPKEMKMGVIINTSSGGCDGEAESEMKEILNRNGVKNFSVWCGEGKEMVDALSKAKEHQLDVLIVLGGDGTIRMAAEICPPDGPFMVPLPGGTLNMLPRALYGEGKWQEILEKVLSKPHARPVSAGRIGKHQFFVAAILGGAALWGKAREALREKDFGGAIVKGAEAFQGTLALKLEYRLGTQSSGEAEAIVVMCPTTSAVLSDDEQVLEAAALSVEKATEVLRLASAAAFGEWRKDPSATVVRAKYVEADSAEDLPAMLDGEPVFLGKEVRIEFVPQSFKALVF